MTFDEITEHIDAYDQRELANTTQLICEIGYSYHEELGVYLPDGIDGMCAELDDGCNLDDDAPWNE